MNIWLINHYAVPIKYWPANRTSYFAKYLLRAGHNVRVIAASTVHNSELNLIKDDVLYRDEIFDGIPYTYIKCRPYKGNGIKRIVNMFEFGVKLERIYKRFGEKPDVVLGSSLTPLACVEAIRIARRYHVKSIVEIRDLWPETAVAYGMISRTNPILVPMYFFEKKLYEYADDVIFTIGGGYDYIKKRGWAKDIPINKIHYINNGVDLEQYDMNRSAYQIEDSDLQNENSFKVVYVGAIRLANGLDRLIDIAKNLKNPIIKILVWGKGDDLQRLKQRAENETVNNIVFKGYVEKKYIPYITSCADLNIVHYANIQLGEFGVSPNKLFDYMAAGKPILDDRPCNYNPLVECGAGIEVKNPTPENIAKAIEDFAALDKQTYDQYCRNARKGAEKYDFKNLTQKLLQIMTGEESGRNDVEF